MYQIVFLVFMVITGEQLEPVRSVQSMEWDSCWAEIKQDKEMVRKAVQKEKGFEVFIFGMCVPEKKSA